MVTSPARNWDRLWLVTVIAVAATLGAVTVGSSSAHGRATARPDATGEPAGAAAPPSPVAIAAPGPAPEVAAKVDATKLIVAADRARPESTASEPTGNFRFICNASHLAYDDPIVFPGQRGASHLHMFFGNTATDSASTYESLRTTGDGSCQGAALNRSGYWAPAVFNAAGKVVLPDYITVYYKGNGPSAEQIAGIRALPEGLKMIAGYNVAASVADPKFSWTCETTQAPAQTIPNCPTGEHVGVRLSFPPCWDGTNLDSPDHRSHMAYGIYGDDGRWACPADHPVLLPEYSIGIWFTHDGDSQDWYLSSDRMPNMTHANGSSFHADWFGAWDPTVMQTWLKDCVDALLNCVGGELGNGTQLSPAPDGATGRIVDPPARP